MDYQLTKPQYQALTATEAYVGVVAGFDSGKTQNALIQMLTTKLKYPSVDLAYLAPTVGDIKTIFYPRICELLQAHNLKFKRNKSEGIISIHGYGRILAKSMESKIHDWQCGDAFLNELDTLPKEQAISVIRRTTARCR
ncbi:MAG: terminase large subunit domain-containing protein [Thiohalomonadales bacterium]